MPRKNNQTVRLHGEQFGFGDDGYPRSRSIGSELLRIHFADIRNFFPRQAAVLQQDIPLGGSTERRHGFPCGSSALDEFKQITLRPSCPLRKSLVRRKCVETHFALPV